MGHGHTECLPELGLLGFSFGQRRSKLQHEVQGERSLEPTVGNVFPGTPALAILSAGGVVGGEALSFGGATEARTGEMESLCGADLTAVTFLADKEWHLSP